MKSNKNSSIYSIRVKLVSAVAMLLVATIMVVSSTYAWFTLSTAPEITGVSTAVGANGALEMLLATKDADGKWFYGTGSVGEKSEVERNSYWGNLVKLDDTSYGSQAITLYPSKLNLNDGKLNLLEPLQTPVFGDDGRVESTPAGGNFAKYNGTNFVQDDSYYGFRALGVASGLSERQQAFRSAVSSVATAQYNAQTEARRSLSANGTPLANIAVNKAMNDDNAKFKQADVDAIGSMVSALEVSLKQVEEAYIQAIIAYALGKKTTPVPDPAADKTALSYAGAIKNAATIENAALGDRLNAVFSLIGADATTIKTAMDGYGIYESAVEEVLKAKNAHGAITKADEYSWTDIDDALTPLVNVSSITINTIPAGQVTQEANKNQIAGDILGGKGVQVNIPTNGGVYADIADLAGDYTVDIEIQSDNLNVGVDGITIKATMTADSTQATPYLAQVSSKINANDNQPADAAAGALPLTELYGYVIDLAFRTNAAQSNLLLQTDAKDRIYSDNNNIQTMGSGSTMTFKSSSSDFTTQKVKDLMSNIRVVFYSTVDQSNMAEIYATAKLDVVNGVVEDANGVTAKLYTFKTATAIKADYDHDNDDTTEARTLYKVDGKYYDSTVCIPGKNEVTPAEGSVTDTAETAAVELRDNVITALNQGVIKHVSALVYLDGENIENDDVAATVAQSMTGSVNFQFASSATLVPMEYGNLHTPNSNENN